MMGTGAAISQARPTGWKNRREAPPGKCPFRACAGQGRVLVLSPEGVHPGTISIGQPTSNCAFNAYEPFLYISADSYVARIPLK